MAEPEFTPTQRRILTVLSDGACHPHEELATCLNDDLAGPKALDMMISLIRKKLRPLGQNIICETFDDRKTFRHVRIVSIAE